MTTDALEYSRELRAGGLSQEQADSVVRVMGESQRKSEENLHKTLATKQDFADFKNEIKQKLPTSKWNSPEWRRAHRGGRSGR